MQLDFTIQCTKKNGAFLFYKYQIINVLYANMEYEYQTPLAMVFDIISSENAQ